MAREQLPDVDSVLQYCPSSSTRYLLAPSNLMDGQWFEQSLRIVLTADRFGDQMVLMADGLAGHEHDFYRYVKSSPWLGGNEEYSSLNEGFPYWFNGLVPLAYGLDDERLKTQVLSAADYIINHAAPDGWIGPENSTKTRNFWARYPAFLGLTQLVEADPSQASTIIPAMHKFFGLMHSMLADNYTGYITHPGDVFDAQWGRARFQDMMITLQWMYENYPENNTQILLDNMKYLNDKAFDWAAWYNPETFIKQDLDTVPLHITVENFQFEHGVNAGQGSLPWCGLI